MIRRPAPRFFRRRRDDESGFVIVLFAALMVAMLGLAAIVVDLGQQRASRRTAQSIADFAALGGGKALSAGDIGQACLDAITYLNTNVKNLTPKINAGTFCAGNGNTANNVTLTNCSVNGGTVQAKPTQTVGPYSVTFLYPVLDSDMADANYTGTGKRGGTACQRMAVRFGKTDPSYFGRILGNSSTSVSRTAVVKQSNSRGSRIPALWLLDPYGCTPLTISGGAQLTLGDESVSPPIPGVATVDSDATACSSNQHTVSASGTGTYLKAVPVTGLSAETGVIALYALPMDATDCGTGKACDQADVNAGRISPQPSPALERATRAPVDWQYNCKRGPTVLTRAYPPYHGVPMGDCPLDVTSGPYMDQLHSLVKTSGQPVDTSFVKWSGNCNVPTGTVVIDGNSWVDCNTLSIGAGTDLIFRGNVVFDGLVKMTGGSLSFNTGNTRTFPSSCQAAVTITCLGSSSNNAAFAYFRNGDLNVTGGGVRFNHTAVYQNGGAIKYTGGVAPIWSPPLEGPFAGLSLWSEASTAYTISGGGGLDLTGVFFTPEADPFKITGGGGVNQQHAQFISYHLDISGNGELKLAPDQTRPLVIPPKAGLLIR